MFSFKSLNTLILSAVAASLLFSALPASAKNKEPWVFISCSGFEQVTNDTKKNVDIYSSVFYNPEKRMYSESTIKSSFGKYLRAHYPKINYNECTYWDDEAEREAKDSMNNLIADSRNNKFKIIRTGFEY